MEGAEGKSEAAPAAPLFAQSGYPPLFFFSTGNFF
jgi:hypothetical protein